MESLTEERGNPTGALGGPAHGVREQAQLSQERSRQ